MKLDVRTVCELTKPLTLLYVEDDLQLRTQTALLFKHFFSNITLADDGQDALDKYQNHHFDLIISDINMPNMNGVEMAYTIKNINQEQEFIFISAHDDSSYLLELKQIGISKFLAKPYKNEYLITLLYQTAQEIIDKKISAE